MLVHRGPAAAAPPPAKRLSDPIDDILRGKEEPAKAPQARGPTKRSGGKSDWSDDLIDFGPLGLADADLALSADRVVHKDVKIGPSRLSLKLDNKVARITLEDMQLYGGRGRGVLTLDGSGEVPVTGVNLRLRGRLHSAPAEGCPGLRVARGTRHHHARACRPGRVGAADGRDAQRQGRHGDRTAPSTASTSTSSCAISSRGALPISACRRREDAFSEFAGSYVITNGVAQNKDLRLVSPRLRVTGQGSIDLAQRQLDYTVNPADCRQQQRSGRRDQRQEHRDPRAHRRVVGQAEIQREGPGADHRSRQADRQEHQVQGCRRGPQEPARRAATVSAQSRAICSKSFSRNSDRPRRRTRCRSARNDDWEKICRRPGFPLHEGAIGLI